MSAGSLRYQSGVDRNGDLREVILALASRHRRYAEERLQIRGRKKIPISYRQPLVRPMRPMKSGRQGAPLRWALAGCNQEGIDIR